MVDTVKLSLGGRANGRKEIGDETGCQLREPSGAYNTLLEDEKDDIGCQNAYIWTDDAKQSTS